MQLHPASSSQFYRCKLVFRSSDWGAGGSGQTSEGTDVGVNRVFIFSATR